MHGHRDPRLDGPDVVDGLGELEPRAVYRDREDVDVTGGNGEGVARVQERAVVDQVRRVRAARHGAVDGGVHAADDLHGRAADREPVPRPHDPVIGQARHRRGRVRVHPQPRPRVRGQQRAQPGRVEVVGVLVGDEHAVEVPDLIESGQHPRVE